MRPGSKRFAKPFLQPVSAWDALSREGLAKCKNGHNDARVKQVIKTLQRLHPAASNAMDAVRQAGLMDSASTQSGAFVSALLLLSDA